MTNNLGIKYETAVHLKGLRKPEKCSSPESLKACRQINSIGL